MSADKTSSKVKVFVDWLEERVHLHQHDRERIAAELRRLEASEAALIEALEWCIEDSANAVNEHVKSYGEAYRAPQLDAMRKAVEKARAALASAKEARNVR